MSLVTEQLCSHTARCSGSDQVTDPIGEKIFPVAVLEESKLELLLFREQAV